MNKKNIPLYIGISLPVILIIVIAVAVYVPRIIANPEYDFIYLVDDSNQRSIHLNEQVCTEYKIENDRLIEVGEQNQYPSGMCVSDEVIFYRHDLSEGINKEISVETVKTLKVDSQHVSPDGWSFRREYANNGIFEIFGGRRNYEWLVVKNSVRLPVNINENYYNVRFVGWVID